MGVFRLITGISCSAFLSFALVQLHAAGTYTLPAHLSFHRLDDHLEILEDPGGLLDFKDILLKENSSRFVSHLGGVPNFGYSGSTYWVRVLLRTSGTAPPLVYLETVYTHLDDITLYILHRDGSCTEMRGGETVPVDRRSIRYRNTVFRLATDELEGSQLYLRISTESSVQIPLILWSPVAFLESAVREQMLFGIFYGILTVMALYNLFLFLFIRDRNYIFYVLYIVFYGLGQFTYNGFSYQYLWPHSRWWNTHSIPFLIGASSICIIGFAISFLNTRWNTPAIHRTLRAVLLLAASYTLIGLIVPYRYSMIAGTVLMTMETVIIFITAIRNVIVNFRPAWYFLIAWTAFLVGIMTLSLKTLGILPSCFITNYAIQCGSALEAILLSIALADRINILRREKEHAERQSLLERTKVLDLQKEIEIARRIHDSILPITVPPSSLLDMKVRYLTMDRLGGDFYDFHYDGDRVGILIADVVGHGIPAALIASMVKMAFWNERSSLADPAALLSSMNNMLLGKTSSQYCTASYTYIDCLNRIITHASGGHLPMVLLRRKIRSIREINPRGPLIGCFRDMRFEAETVAVETGDRVVLYTDGIIECRNGDGELFGFERLYEYLINRIDLTPDAMIDGLIIRLEDWHGARPSFDDDITIIVADIV